MQETDYNGVVAAIADPATPLIVDMHAEWCGYCKRTRPHLETISAERTGSLRIVGIDADENPEVFEELGAKTLPCIVLFVDGKEVARRGSGDYEGLTAWLAENGA